MLPKLKMVTLTTLSTNLMEVMLLHSPISFGNVTFSTIDEIDGDEIVDCNTSVTSSPMAPLHFRVIPTSRHPPANFLLP